MYTRAGARGPSGKLSVPWVGPLTMLYWSGSKLLSLPASCIGVDLFFSTAVLKLATVGANAVSVREKTRTCPELIPPSSFPGAPMAIVAPSLESAT